MLGADFFALEQLPDSVPESDRALISEGLGALAANGVHGSLGHLFSVRAYAIADISFAEPIVFTRMIWATLFGFIAFSEVPDIWTWGGALVIVSATTIIAQRERQAKRRAAAAVPAE